MRFLRDAAITLLVAAVVAAAAGYLLVGRGGLPADRQAGQIETAVATRLVRLSIPASNRAATNPFAADANAWRAGADHFDDHCAVCHGDDGRGRSEMGPHMYPPVPDLASDNVQRLSDGALFWIIQNGVSWTGMPAFRSTHSADDTWRLVSFIRRIPTLTPAELRGATGNGEAVGADDHADHHDSTEHAHTPGEHESRQHDKPDADSVHQERPDVGESGTITMDGTRFQPPEITVSAGQPVRWVNNDPFPHNVTSQQGGFRSGDLQPGASWQFRPAKRGTFRYVCTLHPGMSAVLHVK